MKEVIEWQRNDGGCLTKERKKAMLWEWRLNGLYDEQQKYLANGTESLPNVLPEVSVLTVTGSRSVTTGTEAIKVFFLFFFYVSRATTFTSK